MRERAVLGMKDRFRLMRRIESAVEPDPENQSYIRYKGDDTDQSIANEFSVGIATIRRVRSEMFGNLARGQIIVNSAAVQKQLAELERRVAALEARNHRITSVG